MREAKTDVNITIGLVKGAVGERVKLRVNRGRNKIEEIVGAVENVYPKVFTFRADDGRLNTFCYADVVSKNVRFYRIR